MANADASPQIVLASASPRRRELLRQMGVAFRVVPADVDEAVLPGETPAAYVLRVARDKAAAVWSRTSGCGKVRWPSDQTSSARLRQSAERPSGPPTRKQTPFSSRIQFSSFSASSRVVH